MLESSSDYILLDNPINVKVLPRVQNSPEARLIIEEIGDLAKEFQRNVLRAVRKRRCLAGFCCKYNKMFGTLEQNQQLLQRNFDGKHFTVRGHRGAQLDCMFFPCLVDDKPVVSLDAPRGAYLEKPTFIMCSPNALLYQQMVSSPNTYWLTFFLRREVNVMCWNYRSYGLSKTPGRCCLSFCDAIDPGNIKLDAEKILDFVINQLGVRGKVGLYGRSLGGIAACHLARKYPQVVSALIVDRTFSELDVSSERRLFGSWSRLLYRFVSLNWKAKNDTNYVQAVQCFKIATCDPLDDVVDNYSALPIGVAQKIAKSTFSEPRWQAFYQALKLVYDLESHFFTMLSSKDEHFSFKLQERTTSRAVGYENHILNGSPDRRPSDEEKALELLQISL